jgi:TolB-like protein
VLLNEFAADVAFSKDKAAQSRLERMLVAHPKRRRGTGNARDGTPHTVLVSDIAVMSCAPHMNFLPVGCAAVVKRNLESAAGIVTVKRAESSFVRKRLGFSEIAYKDPVRMAQVARKLEADFLVFGEMGNYKGEYILNLRLADVFSGEVIAITAERFSTLGDLIPALERSAQQLVRNLAVHRDGQ